MLSLSIISFSNRNKAIYGVIHQKPIKYKLGSAFGSSYPLFWEGRKQEYFCEVHGLGKWVKGLSSLLVFVVWEPCPGLKHDGVEVPSSCKGFLGRVRHFTVWLKEIGTANGEQKCRTSAALSETGVAFGPTPPAAISAQGHLTWILCRTQVPEQLSLTTEAWGAAAFFIVEEKHLGHCDCWSNVWKLCSPLHPNEHAKQQWKIQLCLLQLAMDAQIVWRKEWLFQLERLKTLPLILQRCRGHF